MVVDIPKDVQFAMGNYLKPTAVKHKSYQPKVKGDMEAINAAVDLIANAKKPVFYTGGGVINSGPQASQLLREFVKLTAIPSPQP